MPDVQIIADSTCDLTQEQKDRYGIKVVPLYIYLGEEIHSDGVDITPTDLFRHFETSGQTPRTSAATVGDYQKVFSEVLAQGKDIVYIGLSEKMSCTVANARLAAQELAPDRIFVIDSQNLSTGIGLLLLKAGDLAKAGHSAAEIAEAIQNTVGRVRSSFVLNTLEYLRRGGRCSLMASVTAGLLSLHPEIAVADGTMAPRLKFRGKMPLAVGKYVETLLENRDNIEDERVFVTYTVGCKPEIIEAAVTKVRAAGFTEVLESTAGSVISSHCGHDCIGFLFIEKA